jgi:uncharacterized LabA/DUF88 family protein
VPESRLVVFIDGPSLHYSTRALGYDVDFKRLLSWFKQQGGLLRAYYYTTIFEEREYQNTRPLLDWLDYNGFTVKSKSVREHDDGGGGRKYIRNLSVEMAVDAIEIARHVDAIMLFSGDGDLRPAVEAIQRRGVIATVVSTIRSQPPILADELRRQADQVHDLHDLRKYFGRATRSSNNSSQQPPAAR